MSVEEVERRFVEAGMSAEVARRVGVQIFCLIEGAFLMARSAKSTEAMDVARTAAVAAVRTGLRGGERRSTPLPGARP